MTERKKYPDLEFVFPEEEPTYACACVLNAEEAVRRLGGVVLKLPGPVRYLTYLGPDGAQNFHAVAVLPDGKVVDFNRPKDDRVFESVAEYLTLGIQFSNY